LANLPGRDHHQTELVSTLSSWNLSPLGKFVSVLLGLILRYSAFGNSTARSMRLRVFSYGSFSELIFFKVDRDQLGLGNRAAPWNLIWSGYVLVADSDTD
jgi:hypothetical protein